MAVTYLFNLEYNLIKYELAMVSLNITVEWGAIHSKTCSKQQGEYEGTCVLFSYMLYIGYAHSNRSTENCLVSSSIFSLIGGLDFSGHEMGKRGKLPWAMHDIEKWCGLYHHPL